MITEYMVETQGHKRDVFENIRAIAERAMEVALQHDESKYMGEELPLLATKQPEDHDKAMEHHYKLNRHHPEHFPNGISGMCLVDLIEMYSDWLSDAEEEGKDFLQVLEEKQSKYQFSNDLKNILHNTFVQSHSAR